MGNSSTYQYKDNVDALRVITIPIDSGVVSLRGLSPQRLRFEIEYALERGTTDNSFLFTSDKKETKDNPSAILVHPPGSIYGDTFISELKKVLPDLESKLLVVVGHVNPNRVNLLKQLKETSLENIVKIELII